MSELTRRAALQFLASSSMLASCKAGSHSTKKGSSMNAPTTPTARKDLVVQSFDLQKGRPWPTPDPFLFCVHHNDRFPKGNGQFGPATSLAGRNIGMDFDWKDGWNMYHGDRVPGFPAHPHRGFETVTVVREGRLDHADSLGAAARYGDGDVQWLTAGAGIQHAEMFPLLSTEENNPLDLFQIWLNLPSQSKLVEPYFSMLWSEDIPVIRHRDGNGHATEVSIRAGEVSGTKAPSPPPDSWAANPHHHVTILTGKMAAGAQFVLPEAPAGVHRFLYLFEGSELSVGSHKLRGMQGAQLAEGTPIQLEAGDDAVEFLLLGGKPIGEPVAQHGPFVMNTRAELQQAYHDYQTTRFGGWPWDDDGPVHGSDRARFARRQDGSIERPRGA